MGGSTTIISSINKVIFTKEADPCIPRVKEINVCHREYTMEVKYVMDLVMLECRQE